MPEMLTAVWLNLVEVHPWVKGRTYAYATITTFSPKNAVPVAWNYVRSVLPDGRLVHSIAYTDRLFAEHDWSLAQ